MPAAAIRELAHAFAKADKAMICWTLGITEHHNAVDNVLALINLALLTGHVGKYGSGLNPLRGQNNVQGGGDMGALPDRLPGFQYVENDVLRKRCEMVWGCDIPAKRGWHLSGMLEAMDRGELTALYVIGENPLQSEADRHLTERRLGEPRLHRRPGHLPDRDRGDRRRRPARRPRRGPSPRARSRTPSGASSASARRSTRRARRARTSGSSTRSPGAWATTGARPPPRGRGTRSAPSRPVHRGMTYPRLEALGGIQWPCWDEDAPGRAVPPLPPLGGPGARAPGAVRRRSTTTRRSTSSTTTSRSGSRPAAGSTRYNTGVQSGGYTSPLRRGESLDISPEDAASIGLADGERVRVVSRRGSLEVPVRIDPSLRPGLTFMTLHFQDDVATNILTIDATDPKSGTAEFKATAIRIEKLEAPVPA